jgi:hypothetical protein
MNPDENCLTEEETKPPQPIAKPDTMGREKTREVLAMTVRLPVTKARANAKRKQSKRRLGSR